MSYMTPVVGCGVLGVLVAFHMVLTLEVVLGAWLVLVTGIYFWGDDMVAKRLWKLVETKDRDWLGADIEFKNVKVRLLFGIVVVEGVTVKNPDKHYKSEYLLHAGKLKIDLNMWGLITSRLRKVEFEEVSLDGVTANYEKRGWLSGRTNFGDLYNFLMGGEEQLMPTEIVKVDQDQHLEFDGPAESITEAWYGCSSSEWSSMMGNDVTDKVKMLLESQGGKMLVCDDTLGGHHVPMLSNVLLVKSAHVLKKKGKNVEPQVFHCLEGETLRITGDVDLIAKAWYGDGDHNSRWCSSKGTIVTEAVRKGLREKGEIVVTNDLFGDPCPGVAKVLLARTGADVPPPSETITCNEGCRLAYRGNGQKVTAAWWGDAEAQAWSKEHGVDVTDKVKTLLKNKQVVKACDSVFGDPAPGHLKVLRVQLGQMPRDYVIKRLSITDVNVNAMKTVVAISDMNYDNFSEDGFGSIEEVLQLVLMSIAKTVMANVVGKKLSKLF
mmetsp:Transcript_29466/g.80590  ORF Transcript_29466/g.80590 Transcript_29466/m.80590 type:complete len:493 (-) Transcript_29466:40-1518(-)